MLTGYGELLLAEFKYGAQPKETFAGLPFIGDQAKPNRSASPRSRLEFSADYGINRLFYHFKKDLFPWAYWNHMVCSFPIVCVT